ncbi:MAG: Gfo/Idh/MocA family oxidoreductase [Inquilinus sp.]|nr:Gfo/Idh/MocA family oxidoreductase [Inquilinus sp.]
MTGKLRVAVAGAGYFSRFQYAAWARLPDVELVAACNRTEAGAREVAGEYRIPETFAEVPAMLDAVRPDLLDIVTPPEIHFECIRAGAERGVAMVCQKPFCRTLAEAEEAVSITVRAGVTLAVHENFRFQPWYGEAKRLLDTGALGEPLGLTFRLRPGDGRGPSAYLARQPYFRTMPRFLVHETAIHLIDTFRYLLGEVGSVYADLRRLNPVIAGEDAGQILLAFGGGARGLIDGNRLVDHVAQDRRRTMGEMLLEGSEAVLRLDGDGRLYLRPLDSNEEQECRFDWQDVGFGGDCVYRLQRHVVRHLLAGERLSNSGVDYLVNLRIEEAVYRSAAEGRRIALGEAAR